MDKTPQQNSGDAAPEATSRVTPKPKAKSPRHRAREFAVQGLYQWQVGGQDIAAIQVQAESVAGFEKIDRVLYLELLEAVMDNAPALEELLQPHLSRPWGEVSPIERSILLLATGELRDRIDTPYRVVINEAIELAKTYGGAEGHKFVNGVLDKLAPQLRPVEAAAR